MIYYKKSVNKPYFILQRSALMKKGGWVFISHSHQDIDLVRKIRNYLESLGFEPLMFYLKCLSDESEIEELIKREINEREWFIYADSPNARGSKWVKTEREYIEKLTGKRIFTIDLSADIATQLREIERISRQMKVFISASSKDKELKQKICDKLTERDMLILSDEDFSSGQSWVERAKIIIDEAARNGFVIILITEAFLHSSIVKYEIDEAIKGGGKIIPVYVGNAKMPENILELLGDTQGVRIGESPSDEELNKIVDSILQRVEYYESDFRDGVSYRSARTVHLPPIARIDGLTFFDCDNLECVYIPDTVIYITPDAFDEHPDILIRCYSGSYAERYCKVRGIKYELINE